MNAFRTRREKAFPHSPAFAINSPFGQYKPEKEQAIRQVDVKSDPKLQQMISLCKRYLIESTGLITNFQTFAEVHYEAARGLFEATTFSASAVEKFSIALTEFQHENDFFRKTGIFLSALINNGAENNYVIHTYHLEKPIDYLGYENTKTITVEGNLGTGCCELMKRGKVIVKGSAGSNLGMSMTGGGISIEGNVGSLCGFSLRGGYIAVDGNVEYGVGELMHGGRITVRGNGSDQAGLAMAGGEIILEGNAGDSCGGFRKDEFCGPSFEEDSVVLYHMEEGRIFVKGNVGKKLGDGMLGGEIHIDGDIGSIGDVKHGKIFHKGKLIVDK